MPKLSLKRLEPWQDVRSKPYIELQNISKTFGSNVVLDSVTLAIYQSELFCLLGGSGSGKSTLLRILAGFEKPSSGRVLIDGMDITETPPYERPVNMMFQSYALFPHMTVEENIAFGLRQENLSQKIIRERTRQMLNIVHMKSYAHRKPDQLSGGQKQRVALARSLARQPKVLLLDEPLAALDKVLREKTQFELVNIQEELGITFLMVTHDQEEAMTVSSRMGIMENGRLRQVGTPGEIYEYPNSLFVADFIGSINTFEALVTESTEKRLSLHSEEIGKPLHVHHTTDLPPGVQVTVAVRPEKVKLSVSPPQEAVNSLKGIVEDIGYLGDVSIYHVRLETGKILLATEPNLVRLAERPVTWEDTVYLSWESENCIILTS
jgi:putrescine transport system ATP-binding protein